MRDTFKDFWIKLYVTVFFAVTLSSMCQSCAGTPSAHAAGTGIGESAYRMANALERIAEALERKNRD